MSRTRQPHLDLSGRRATLAPSAPPVSPASVVSLVAGQEAEVLGFLASRPVHTVVMSSFIRDNGLESSFNRGRFHGCRDASGGLTGVALFGHATLFEARDAATLEALARAAGELPPPHMIIGESAAVRRFWSAYAPAESAPPHRVCRELLYEQRWPVEVREHVDGLRPATMAEAGLVSEVHAHLAELESGVNPLAADASGFADRIARRIGRGRVWVWVRDGRLVFKADVLSVTPEVAYLEGVYVRPEDRGRGYGLRCLSQLSRDLLLRATSVCLLVNDEHTAAQNLYRRAGYKFHSRYETIFLRRQLASRS